MAGLPTIDDGTESDDAVALGKAFCAAASNRDEAKCLSLLAQIADPNVEVESGGRTLLMVAAQSGMVEVCGRLIENGASTDIQDDGDRTALYLGISHPKVVQLLIESGADPTVENYGDDGDPRTAFSAAAGYGYVDSCWALIDPDRRLAEEVKRHALLAAARNDRSETLDVFSRVWPDAVAGCLEEMLEVAAEEGAVGICANLIALGAPSDSLPALLRAAGAGRLSVCQLLVQGGADVNAFNHEGYASLHAAAVAGSIETVPWLIANGADVNGARGDSGWTPLHAVVEHGFYRGVKLCRLLIAAGADTSLMSRRLHGLTPFQFAVSAGRADIVEFFVSEAGEDLAQQAADGRSLVDLAADNNEIRQCILSAASADLIGAALVAGHASPSHNGDPLSVLADVPGPADASPEVRDPCSEFSAAVMRGDLKACRECLARGEDVNQLINVKTVVTPRFVNGSGGAMWHDVSQVTGESALLFAARAGDVAMCKLLLESGADVNSGGERNFAPIFWALENVDLCRLLVAHHVNVAAVDIEWNSALAVAAREGNTEICAVLANGVGVDDEIRKAALSAAACAGHAETLSMLLEKWPDVNAPAVDDAPRPFDEILREAAGAGQTESCRRLIAAGAERLVCALASAAQEGHFDTCIALLDLGANVNGHGCWGQRPMHSAVASDSVEIVRLMLDRGADIHVEAESTGMTPIYSAIRRGWQYGGEIVRVLVQAGADLAPVCSVAGDLTPFQFAVVQGHMETAKFFVDECGEDPAQLTCDGLTLVEAADKYSRSGANLDTMRQFLHARRTGLLVDGAFAGQRETANLRRSASLSPL